MDKLEEFIRNNRNQLDRYSPSPGLWRRIRKVLTGHKLHVNEWVSIAAMVTVILSTAIILYSSFNKRTDRSINITDEFRSYQSAPQLKETEIYYNNRANSLYNEASPMLTANPEIERELKNDISQLDSICIEIKKDLKDDVANVEVVEALIQNYRCKVQLLEEMLLILKENEKNPEKPASYDL